MANQVTGKVHYIGNTEAIPYGDKTFYKRELVLDASRYDQYSGQKFENYPKFEFTGNNCAQLDQFQVGQVVTVSFTLSGRKSEKNGVVNYFTNITGYKVEPYVREQQAQTQQAQGYTSPSAPIPSASPAQVAQPQPQAPAQTPFPPALDENGNPITDGDGLPF